MSLNWLQLQGNPTPSSGLCGHCTHVLFQNKISHPDVFSLISGF
uniref:Uncharacterized protein n=1 Tax=Trichinella nativa TaxID=6335 RepID=A0A0V1KI88_9BILA